MRYLPLAVLTVALIAGAGGAWLYKARDTAREAARQEALFAELAELEACGKVDEVGQMFTAAPGLGAMSTPFDLTTSVAQLSVVSARSGPARAGEEARLTLALTDRATGAPLTGQDVAGWMALQRSAQVAAEIPCRAKAALYAQGRVTARADVDLNASRLLILNRDGSLALVNPQVDFTITQMEGVLPLPGVPADWTMGPDGRTVFISLPVYGAVAVVDAIDLAMTGLIEFPKGSMPTTLLARRDGSLAVYLSAPESVVVARPDGTGKTKPLAVGPGPIAMASGTAGRIFTVAASGRVMALDPEAGNAAELGVLPTGEPSVAVSVGDAAVYAATDASDEIRVFDTGTLTQVDAVKVEAGVFTLSKVPGVSQVVALNPRIDRMVVIDSTVHKVIAETLVAEAPVEVAYSHDYVYVRGLEGDHFTILDRAELAEGRLTPLNVQSAASPVVRREALSRARMIAPYGHGALVVNEDEAQAYYYMEGMNSAMGTVKTYGQLVQGVMTVDRGFRETAPGIYETTATLPFGGTYDVPVAIGSPDTVVCLPAFAEGKADAVVAQEALALTVTAEAPKAPVARAEETFVFTVLGPDGKPVPGLRDLRLLAFAPSGTWQSRQWASDLGGGHYAAAWVFPKAGRYGVSLEAPSHDLAYADTPPFYVKVSAERSPIAD
jgi:DNA-binding beta-propeller fold protein YncE